MAKKSQIQKFRDKARELEADESSDKFDAALRKVATHKPAGAEKTPAKPKDGKR
jgi:hypothetical protein